MRPVSVFANGPGSVYQHLCHLLHHRWRVATRAVMVLLSTAGVSAAEIGELLDYHPAAVRRWIHRYNTEGVAGLADRPRPGGPASAAPARPAHPPPAGQARTVDDLPDLAPFGSAEDEPAHGVPAGARAGRLAAKGDPDRQRILAALRRRLTALSRRSVVLAEDETHLHLLPHVRASWIPRGMRQQVAALGKNRQATVFGALNLTAGAWVYTFGLRSPAAFIAFLQVLPAAYPTAPAIAVLCDNDSIHHAKAVTAYLADHPRLRLLFGPRYSPHDNPVERIWAALKATIANTAVTWPGRQRQVQVHAFFRKRSPTQMLTTAAPWTSPWLPKSYAQNFRPPA